MTSPDPDAASHGSADDAPAQSSTDEASAPRRRIVRSSTTSTSANAAPAATSRAASTEATTNTPDTTDATGSASAGTTPAPAEAKPRAARKPRAAKGEQAAKAASRAEVPPRKGRRAEADASSDPPSSQRDPAGASDDEDEDDSDESDEVEPIDAAAELVEPADELSEDGEFTDQEPQSLARPRGGDDEREEREESKLALSRNDPLQAYLREVQRHPLLTPTEEQTLAQRYAATQDVDAAARLVTANLRLVVKIAYEYRRAYKNIMDLIQEGNIGLMQAVKKYDPNRGVKLSSYSAWWIRAYILRYIINNWRLVKLGTTQAQRKLFFNLNKEKAKLAAMGIDPTPELIAKNLGVEAQEAVEMERRLSSGEMSLDAPVGDNEGRPVSRIELMASGLAGPDSTVADGELSGMVHDKLVEFRATLKGKDLDIFDKRLVADEPLTLQELGDQFGISRERVRQIEARLTGHLRTFLVQALGDAVEG